MYLVADNRVELIAKCSELDSEKIEQLKTKIKEYIALKEAMTKLTQEDIQQSIMDLANKLDEQNESRIF